MKMIKNKYMKKLVITFLILFIGLSSLASKTSKPSCIPDEELGLMSLKINHIIEKMYGGAFLSPSDSKTLIGIKIKLDDNMLLSPEPQYAPLYYKLGQIYQKRGDKKEAIDCYQTIIENFSDTVLAEKSVQELKTMGIEVKLPAKNTVEEEE